MIKKIVFGITGLTLGGAERVLVDLANKLIEKYDITIFTLYSKGDLEKEVNKNVKIETFYKKSYNELIGIKKKIIPLKILLFRKKIYRKLIKNRFDIEIAFLEGPITRIFSIKNSKVKKLAWVHNDISKVFGQGSKAKIKKIFDKNIYEKYNKIVCVSADNLEKFTETYNLKDKVVLIPNYIDSERILKKSTEKINNIFSKNEINIVTVARLVEQKAIDRLIDVHTTLIKSGIKNRIYVIGDGPLKEKLINKIKENNVADTFILLGKKENPYPYIKFSDCFCLLSYFEGYGMVIEEAKILNKPIIITNTAAREALINYEYGYICENSEKGIYNQLSDFICNNVKYQTNSDNIEYTNKNIINDIIMLLEK